MMVVVVCGSDHSSLGRQFHLESGQDSL